MAIKAGRVGVDPSQVTLSGYIKGGGVSPEVLTKEEAQRIYQTIMGMSEYLKKVDANSLYQTIADMVNYQAKLVSGQNIKRINGEDILGSGNITVLTRTLADGIYQTISGMSDYALKSEIPDMEDVLTIYDAPGYDDILTKTQARTLYTYTGSTGIEIANNVLTNVFEDLPSGTNLDDVKYNYQGYVIAPVNGPESSNSGTVCVISRKSGTQVFQLFTPYNKRKTYYRIFNTEGGVGTWTDWGVIEERVLVITSASFSSLPLTVNDSRIKTGHVVVNSVLSNPFAQTGDWTITTNDGSLTISGSISGSTNIILYLLIQ